MKPGSAWSPLRHRPFLWLWIAVAIVNLAIWMQTVGAAWIMTTLSSSPLMVSLVQTAIALPVFLFGLPGGVVADLVDRRRWLMLTQGIMFAAALVLCGLAYAGLLQAWSLLLFTFVLGTGSALSMSAWMVTIIGVLPRDQVPAAVSINGISMNAARALGPALAGALIAYWSAASVFLVIAVCFAGVIIFLFRMAPEPRVPGLPAETFRGGMRSGVRYIWHSPALFSALKQVFVFTLCASALWALLPLVAKDDLGMEASGYGLLMGCLGAGAVLAAFYLTRLYQRFALRQLIIAGAIGFAVATLAAAVVHNRLIIYLMLMVAGMAWMAVNATISTVIQTSAADWVRARVASVYLLMLMGAMAVGGVIWGFLAQHFGLSNTLLLSALTLVLGLFVTRNGPLALGQQSDYAGAQPTEPLVLVSELAPDGGAVSLEISYRVSDAERPVFLAAVQAVSKSRRRNGAQHWRLYRDLSEPSHYVERFTVASWLEYQRQNVRLTLADQSHEQLLARFRCTEKRPRQFLHQTA